MDEQLSTIEKLKVLKASLIERKDYEIGSTSESDESSSGETKSFDEEFLGFVDNSVFENGQLNAPDWFMIELGNISNIFRNPNKKVGKFYPGPPSWTMREEIDDFKGKSYRIVLARCWQIEPDCIQKEDIKYIELPLKHKRHLKLWLCWHCIRSNSIFPLTFIIQLLNYCPC
jgi:hypothetical protein